MEKIITNNINHRPIGQLVPLKEIQLRYGLTRATLRQMKNKGVIDYYSLPTSGGGRTSKVFIDINQFENSMIKKE